MKNLLLVIVMLVHFISQGFADESIKLTEGKFGKTFIYQNNPTHWIAAKALKEYQKLPLTIECWAKSLSSESGNSLLSLSSREYRGHWELNYSRGAFSTYLTSYAPDRVVAKQEGDPSEWHYCAAVFTESQVRIYIDGIEKLKVSTSTIKDTHLPSGLPDDSMLLFKISVFDLIKNQGKVAPGLVDEIRISDIERKISGIPDGPFESDEHTIGLWHFDELDPVNGFLDASSKQNHAKIVEIPKISLDDLDKRSYAPTSIPMESPYKEIKIKPGKIELPKCAPVFSLDGTWELAEEGMDADRVPYPWSDAISAEVPGSVQTALLHAGLLPDPQVGKNAMLARDKSFKDHWYRKTFSRPSNLSSPILNIQGICETYSVWMNGVFLGDHKGKYIPRAFDLLNVLKDSNDLVIKVNKINRQLKSARSGQFNGSFEWSDSASRDDVDIDSTMGNAIVNAPFHGIWKSVTIEENPETKILDPFVVTENAANGVIHLLFNIQAKGKAAKGKVIGQIMPENFKGESYAFSEVADLKAGGNCFHYKLKIPDPKLWWPVDMGKPNLYRLKLAFIAENGSVDVKETTFGIRTLERKPLPGGPYVYQYNWQFVINGKPLFVKGVNWVQIDSYLDLRRERYERFIQLAKDQHIQMFRSWGLGLTETETFYDLCDRYGIMVYQEFHSGPYHVYEQGVTSFILQRRNHPSLVMYGGDNELYSPYDELTQLIGRLALELDGTRAIHRTDPWGGSIHDYRVLFGHRQFEWNLRMDAPFCGEFGFNSTPNMESVVKYMPEKEKALWPVPKNGSFNFHGYYCANDVESISFHAKELMPLDTLDHFITGGQLAQATCLRVAAEEFRTAWPRKTGLWYFQFNEMFAGTSFGVVDWYGAPKLSHYFMIDAYEPLHACAIVDELNPARINPGGIEFAPKIYLLDDNNALQDSEWEVRARAYDSNLKLVAQETYPGSHSINKVKYLGGFSIHYSNTLSIPLLVVTEVYKNGSLADRTFYWLNFEAKPGCLMELPKTTLKLAFEGNVAVIQNTGDVPAVGVNFDCPAISDKFRAERSYFWLDPKETKRVNVNMTEGVNIKAWNSK